VDNIPEDAYDRQAWLELWAAEQERRRGKPDSGRARLRVTVDRLRAKVVHMIELNVARLEPVFDRGLYTSRILGNIPEIGAVDGHIYAPSPGLCCLERCVPSGPPTETC
jgi:hypothetical protein